MESKDSYKIFSFFNFIFIGKRIDLTPEEKAKVMEHEKVHADHLHSIDLILSDLLIIFFWFNPLIRIYKKKLIQQHEFEADSRAVENSEVNDYCNLLARVALISAGFSLANHFNNSLTIKRITMMQNVKKKINTWKIAGLIIIFPAVAFIAACQKDALNETDKSKSNIPASKEEIYTVVEKLAEFPGGNAKLGEFLGNNLKYPEESVKNGVEGIVYVSFTIDKEGAVHDPVIMKGISKECDAEALRVISLSPKWIPAEQQGKRVNQKMTLPIKFVMSQVKTPQTSSGNVQHLAKPITIETSQYVVNGKPRITGTVFNEARSPIEGATIVQMGTTLGTSTDKNGNFTIDPISSIGELSVSHVNYTIAKLPFNIK
jgi:TonB family protein